MYPQPTSLAKLVLQDTLQFCTQRRWRVLKKKGHDNFISLIMPHKDRRASSTFWIILAALLFTAYKCGLPNGLAASSWLLYVFPFWTAVGQLLAPLENNLPCYIVLVASYGSKSISRRSSVISKAVMHSYVVEANLLIWFQQALRGGGETLQASFSSGSTDSFIRLIKTH